MKPGNVKVSRVEVSQFRDNEDKACSQRKDNNLSKTVLRCISRGLECRNNLVPTTVKLIKQIFFGVKTFSFDLYCLLLFVFVI